MKRLLIALLMLVSIGVSAQDYTIRYYNMTPKTPKYATYQSQTTPTIKLPESRIQINSYADDLEEQVRIKRLRAELRELERRETQNTDNTYLQPNPNSNINSNAVASPVIINAYQYRESKWIPIMLKVIKDGSNIIMISFKFQNQQWTEIQPVMAQQFMDKNLMYSHYIDFIEGRVCFKY